MMENYMVLYDYKDCFGNVFKNGYVYQFESAKAAEEDLKTTVAAQGMILLPGYTITPSK